jgi:DNA invertase Pin-like site-specific DNA recombinase
MTEKRAVGYVRVSTQAQAREGESLQTQRDSISAYCEAHGLELAQVYADEGISGRRQNRPQLKALLAGAARKEFDYVVCARLTRFGRSTRDLLNNLGILEDHGVRFVSLKESMDTSTPAGRLLRTILAGIAEFESEVIRDQMLENRGIRARRGDIRVGRSPYGYSWNKEKRQFETNPQEAGVYRRIVEMYLAGQSYRDITLTLRREGIKAKKQMFSETVIGQLLKNPAYATGRLVRNTHVFKGSQRTKELKPLDQHFELAVPPLIDKLTWDRVQERIAFNKGKAKRIANPEFWLRNVLRCGECGGRVKPRTVNGKFTYYQCFWSQLSPRGLEAAGRKHKCTLPRIPAQELQDLVMGQLLNFLTMGGFYVGQDYYSAPLEEMLGPERYNKQIKALQGQLTQMGKALARKTKARDTLFSMLEEGIDRSLFMQQLEKFGDEIGTLEARIEEAEGKLADLEKGKAGQRNLVDFVKGNSEWLGTIAAKIVNLEPEDKQRLIEKIMDGGKIEVIGGPEPGDEGHFEGKDYSRVWAVNPPLFSFNPKVFNEIPLYKANKNYPWS